MCPLCGEIDTRDHFIQYPEIHKSNQYKRIRDEKRNLANRSGAQDHLINTLAAIMEGQAIEQERIPFHARGCIRSKMQ